MTALASCACTPAGREQWRSTFDRRPPRQLLDVALHDPKADERRRAVDGLADGRTASEEWAVKAFDTIARSDADAMVRVAAVRGLGRSRFAACVPTLVKLLNSAEKPIDETLPAPGAVRWEAALLLERLSAAGSVAAKDREAALTALLARAENDPDHNVRVTAVSALRCYPDRRDLPVLVNALRSRDFALQLRAEATLHALTGQSHDQDPDAWERWIAQAANPLLPAPASRPATRSWWSHGARS